MKTKILTLISLTILASLLLGAFALNAFSAPPRLRVKAYFKPNTYDTSNPVPQPWNVWLHFASSSVNASQIDESSILLEGLYSPMSAPYDLPNRQGSWVAVPFNGYDVLEAALTKIGHMVPGQGYLVFLEVTGQTKDGTPFATGGSGCIWVTDPEVSPP